jgi:hypothetical protein
MAQAEAELPDPRGRQTGLALVLGVVGVAKVLS